MTRIDFDSCNLFYVKKTNYLTPVSIKINVIFNAKPAFKCVGNLETPFLGFIQTGDTLQLSNEKNVPLIKFILYPCSVHKRKILTTRKSFVSLWVR